MDDLERSEQRGTAPEVSEEIASLKGQLDSLKKERDKQAALAEDYLNTARRVQAEFENYKKRTLREREEIVKAANEKLLADLLPVFDDFERALAAQCSEKELKDGIIKIHENIAALLREYEVKEIPSERFDPSVHEAFALGEGEDGKILEVYQKGYFLGNKVLRCSKVKVAKNTGDNNG
ncbi:nucleotide exchange factor GrpE [Methanomassiliicoccus luminyensis]|nr:nucleotide exchange factor GrpE [Methanomassiliicoccus luminyensis]